MEEIASERRSFGSWILLAFVRVYQALLSPILGGACKFYPSCSNYAYQAIAWHGARRGSLLALKRLARCRPFTKGGVDLVPEREDEREITRRANIAPMVPGASLKEERRQ